MPTLPIAAWRGQGRLQEVTGPDLAFDDEELLTALESFGQQPCDTTVAEISHTTAGWPVAVYLWSTFGRGGLHPESSVSEYLDAEVLDPLPARLKEFLRDIAGLDVVNHELARHVTGLDDSAQLLHALRERSLLLGGADDDWYHPHALLHEHVRARLHAEDPRRLSGLHAKAAEWFFEEGYPEQAVKNAILSADTAVMGSIIWTAGRDALLRGRSSSARRWLDAVGEERISQSTRLSVTAGWTAMGQSDFSRVPHYLPPALASIPEGWMSDLDDRDLEPHLALLIATTGHGLSGARECAQLARRAHDAMFNQDPTRPLAKLIEGLNLALIGDPAAVPVLMRTAALATSLGVPTTSVEANAVLGLVYMADGEDTRACDAIETALALFAQYDLAVHPTASSVMALATVALRSVRGRTEELQQAIADLNARGEQAAELLPWYRPLAQRVLALACVRSGRPERGRMAVSPHDDHDDECALCHKFSVRVRHEEARTTPLARLTPAEMRVWDLLTSRLTLSEIAAELYLSRETVKSHTGSIYRKLGVASRREAQDLAETWT